MVKGHYVACACDILGISSVDEPPVLPPGIHKATDAQKLALIKACSQSLHSC